MTPSAAAVATAASTALPPSCKTFRPISVAYGSTDDTAPPLPMAIGSFGGAVGTALAGGATSTMATMAVSAEARNAERGAMTDPSPGDSGIVAVLDALLKTPHRSSCSAATTSPGRSNTASDVQVRPAGPPIYHHNATRSKPTPPSCSPPSRSAAGWNARPAGRSRSSSSPPPLPQHRDPHGRAHSPCLATVGRRQGWSSPLHSGRRWMRQGPA